MDGHSERGYMMALRSHRRGGPETLVYESAPKPVPGHNEVLIAVSAAAITFAELGWDETWTRDGSDRTPIIPSHEVSGVVAGVGQAVSDFEIGAEVWALTPFDRDGGAADYVAVDASIVAHRPLRVSHIAAAATPLAALTAWQAFVDHAKLEPGQRVLIHGGGGGVGLFAIQIAHSLGAEVTTTARSADAKLLTDLGATRVIDFRREQFDADGVRYDVVLDGIGGETTDRSLRVIRPGGQLVTLNGPASAETAEALGVTATFFIVSGSRPELDRLASMIDDGELKIIVAEQYPLAEGRAAFESGARHGRAPGKTVLVVRE